jgi:hypothetical protein
MPDRYEHALRVLGLEPGATEQAVKDAYRDLVKVWHPDRFGSDARLRAKAQEKLKEVNAAFKDLRGYSPRHDTTSREFARPPVPAPSVEPPKTGRTRYVLMLLLAAAVAGFAGTVFLMQRGQGFWEPFSIQQQVQVPDRVPAAAATSATRTPATQQTVKRGAPPSDTSRESAASSLLPGLTGPSGSLLVTSRPLGARVSLDGTVVGETPLSVSDVAPGEHRLEVSLDGNAYQPWSSSVVVTAGHEEKLLAVMTPIPRKR